MMKNYKNKEWLEQKYVNEGLSTLKIAELCGANFRTIWSWLKRFDIEIRTLSEARRLRPASGMLGKHHTEEAKKRIGKASKGRGAGRKLSGITRKKISEAAKGRWTGEKNPLWKGGVSFEPYGREFSKDLRNEVIRLWAR